MLVTNFGSERAPLTDYVPILRDFQDGCFYCGKKMRTIEVDHFIPWTKYPHDLGHNFVLADRACNNAKRDRLATLDFKTRWEGRNRAEPTLTERLRERGLAFDLAATLAIGDWAYALVTDPASMWSP